MPTELDRVRQVAERDKNVRLTALWHHVSVERLRNAFGALRPKGAAGVDGVTWHAYEQNLEGNLRDLHDLDQVAGVEEGIAGDEGGVADLT